MHDVLAGLVRPDLACDYADYSMRRLESIMSNLCSSGIPFSVVTSLNTVEVAFGPPPYTAVGCHYDSVEGSPGANDNASGVAVCLDLAHRLRDCPGVKVVFHGSEELGCLGSQRYLMGDRRIASYYNLDMVGVGDRICALPGSDPMLLARLEDVTSLPYCLGRSDDHSYRMRGIPAAGIMALPSQDIRSMSEGRTDLSIWETYHNEADTRDTLDLSAMRRISSVIEKALRSI